MKLIYYTLIIAAWGESLIVNEESGKCSSREIEKTFKGSAVKYKETEVCESIEVAYEEGTAPFVTLNASALRKFEAIVVFERTMKSTEAADAWKSAEDGWKQLALFEGPRNIPSSKIQANKNSVLVIEFQTLNPAVKDSTFELDVGRVSDSTFTATSPVTPDSYVMWTMENPTTGCSEVLKYTEGTALNFIADKNFGEMESCTYTVKEKIGFSPYLRVVEGSELKGQVNIFFMEQKMKVAEGDDTTLVEDGPPLFRLDAGLKGPIKLGSAITSKNILQGSKNSRLFILVSTVLFKEAVEGSKFGLTIGHVRSTRATSDTSQINKSQSMVVAKFILGILFF